MVRIIPHPDFGSQSDNNQFRSLDSVLISLAPTRMNRRKADFKFAYKFLEDDL